jgi:hypothetical protein
MTKFFSSAPFSKQRTLSPDLTSTVVAPLSSLTVHALALMSAASWLEAGIFPSVGFLHVQVGSSRGLIGAEVGGLTGADVGGLTGADVGGLTGADVGGLTGAGVGLGPDLLGPLLDPPLPVSNKLKRRACHG